MRLMELKKEQVFSEEMTEIPDIKDWLDIKRYNKTKKELEAENFFSGNYF